MKAYLYQAALLCEACDCKLSQEIPFPEGYVEGDESSYDSYDFPKGPYGDGGGEADTPQHCDHCNVFLENPLTDDGVEYVEEAITIAPERLNDPEDVLSIWSKFYGIEPRHWWTSGDGSLQLQMSLEDAQSASHQGQCDDDVRALSEAPHIAKQLATFSPASVRKELKGYGAWDANELADHDQNLQRILWLAAGSIIDEAYEKAKESNQ